MAGIACLASDDCVLQIDQPEEVQLISQKRPRLFLLGEPKKQTVRPARVAADRSDRMRVQSLRDGSFFPDRLVVLLPHHRTVARRRNIDALHGGVSARILPDQLIPDVEPGGMYQTLCNNGSRR